ncbi:MAG: hypothetical protein OQK24_02835 [Magnetovibrio sp.]|nr:hypothetical protein [Magnetovibrio sp.]
MHRALNIAETGSRSLSYVLGAGVIGLAIAVGATSMGPDAIARWTLEVFGITFITLFSALIFATVYCWARLGDGQLTARTRTVWLEGGLHAANGVSTLALTYTLLGISLGIGTLSDQELTPSTVQHVISQLTDHFSLAFMTTVVGLPTSAALRALILISHSRIEAQEEAPCGS